MRRTKRTIEALSGVCSILAIAGSVVFSAGDAEAKSLAHRAANPSSPVQAADSEIADVSGKPAGSESRPAVDSRPATPTGMSNGGGMQEGSNGKPAAAALARRVALTGIEVSFKLDPQHTENLYMHMGESWVSPPLSIAARAQHGRTPSVEAKAQILDAKGQALVVSPEWTPADPEMVTVSPAQGNEVRITVRHAGQSNLKVASQNVSKELAVMAWYQGDPLQVEISEKR